MPILFTFLTIIFVNCQDFQEQAEINSYVVWVDNLRMRSEPDLMASVVGNLPLGTIVEGSDITSKNTLEIELRGKIYNAPFYFVSDPQGNKGWLYGGAIYKIHNKGLFVEAKEMIGRFINFLERAPIGIDAGVNALSYYHQNFANADPAAKTASSVILIKYFLDLEDQLWNVVENVPWPSGEDVNSFIKSDLPEFNRLRNSSFRIAASEGMFYPEIDWKDLGDEIGSGVDLNIRDFMELKSKDQETMIGSDASILAPIEDLGKRAIRWEMFNLDNPEFVMSDLSKDEEIGYKLLVMTGMDNSPAFDWEGKLAPAFRDGWLKIVEDHEESPFAGLLTTYMDILERNSWNNCKEAEELVASIFQNL